MFKVWLALFDFKSCLVSKYCTNSSVKDLCGIYLTNSYHNVKELLDIMRLDKNLDPALLYGMTKDQLFDEEEKPHQDLVFWMVFHLIVSTHEMVET